MTDPILRELENIRKRVTKQPHDLLTDELVKLIGCVKAIAVLQIITPSRRPI